MKLLAQLREYLYLGVIIGALPYNIQNGQQEDATPVMANFNSIVSQVNNNVPGLIPSLGTLSTFTPTIMFNGLSVGVTYSQQVGQYVNTGVIVFYWIFMILTSKGSSVGNAAIGGLPFTVNSALAGSGNVANACPNLNQVTFADKYVTLAPQPNTTRMQFTTVPSGGGGPNFLTDAAFVNTSGVHASGFYIKA